jgi:prepilin-type processing-associated H-X9-DG protein
VDYKHETGAGALGLGDPTSKEDTRGAQYWRRLSLATGSNVMIDTWYGINAYDPGNGGTPANFVNAQKVWPFRKLINSAAGPLVGELSRITSFRKSSELVLVFDGLRMLDAKSERINARHNLKRGKAGGSTNVLMVDGHAETIPTASTPTLTQAEWRGNLSAFAPWPSPKWRLDQ